MKKIITINRQTVLFCSGMLLLTLSNIYPKLASRLILIPLILSMAVPCIERTILLIRHLAPKTIRKIWKGIIICRRVFSVSPEVELFHALAFLLMMTTSAYVIIYNDFLAAKPVGNILAWIFLVATFLDSTKKISTILRKTWAKILGKILIASSGATLVYLATAIAKNSIQSAVHFDPKFLPESTGLLATITIPALYFALVIIILSAWAVLQLLILIPLGIIFILPKKYPLTMKESCFIKLLNRAKTGKKFPTIEPSGWHSTVMAAIFRPAGMIISICMVIDYTSQLNSHYKDGLFSHLTAAAIQFDYKSGSTCKNLKSDARIIYLDNGLVSILNEVGSKKYAIKKCITSEISS